VSRVSKVQEQGSWYVRALRLRHVRPGGLMSFLLFECVVAIAALLSLAELVSWWAVIALPVAVAVMVKFNDLVSGSLSRVPHTDGDDSWDVAAAASDGQSIDEPGSVPGTRWSQVYISASRQAQLSQSGGSVDEEELEAPAVPTDREPRADDEARRDKVTVGKRATGRTRPARETRSTRDDVERGRARPEWHQTITIGRPAPSDDNRVERGRDTGTAADPADDTRHRTASANQRRFG
jgi:hypothetical protein